MSALTSESPGLTVTLARSITAAGTDVGAGVVDKPPVDSVSGAGLEKVMGEEVMGKTVAGFSIGNTPTGEFLAGDGAAPARTISRPNRLEATKRIPGRPGRSSRVVRCNGLVPWNELVRNAID